MGTYNSELEAQLLALLAKLESGGGGGGGGGGHGDGGVNDQARPPPTRGLAGMLAEVRTLDLWRAVIGECLAAVFYVLLVCGSYSPWIGPPIPPERHLVISLVAGFAMTVLMHCFAQVSGGHINPAVTVSLATMGKLSPLRAMMFVLAQLGGGIAGAALLFGATSSGYTGGLGATEVSRVITRGQAFGVEFLLTFVVVLAYYSAVCPHNRGVYNMGYNSGYTTEYNSGYYQGYNPGYNTGYTTREDHPPNGVPAVIVGLAYLAATLVGLPLTGASMNPARSLGPAFVMNLWDAHWVYWAGPLLGGLTAGFIHEFIFNPRRSPLSRNPSAHGEHGDGGDGGGGCGDEEDASEAIRHIPMNATALSPATAATQYNPLRRHIRHHATRHATASHTPSEIYTPESVYGYDEYIYSGSKSLYTPAPRGTNLHRSQSVYTRPLPVPVPVPVQSPVPAPTGTAPVAGIQNSEQHHKSTGGLLHNNLMIYNAQQQQKQQHYQQQQQQLVQQQQQQQQQQHHLPNNINKPLSTGAVTPHYAKNITNVAQSESEYSAPTSRPTLKANLIKPEPIYKTSMTNHNNHNQQQQQQQQQQQYHTTQPPPTLQNQSYTSQSNPSSNHSSQSGNQTSDYTTQRNESPNYTNQSTGDRCGSVMSGSVVSNMKYHHGEDDDSSQYGNYRGGYGRNRPELATPGSVHSDATTANSLVSYSHYSAHGEKMY